MRDLWKKCFAVGYTSCLRSTHQKIVDKYKELDLLSESLPNETVSEYENRLQVIDAQKNLLLEISRHMKFLSNHLEEEDGYEPPVI